jgi:hypothetical protein
VDNLTIVDELYKRSIDFHIFVRVYASLTIAGSVRRTDMGIRNSSDEY